MKHFFAVLFLGLAHGQIINPPSGGGGTGNVTGPASAVSGDLPSFQTPRAR